MNKLIRNLSILVIALAPQLSHAIPFSFEARSLGMGGVSVSTADLATAAWANPAMLTNQGMDDDFSLLIGIGAMVRDNDDLISDIEDFQDADDRRNAAIDSSDVPAAAQATLDMHSIVRNVESKVIAPEVTGLTAMGIAFDSFAMAISIRTDLIGGGVVTDLSCNPTSPGCDPAELVSDQFNILNVEGVQATEFGVSFAKDFQLFDRKFSFGIKPKIVDLKSFTYRESILTASSGLDNATDKENKLDLGTFSTIDLGMAVDLTDSVRLGLTLRNLITEDFAVGAQTLNFDTESRIGVSYHNSFVTVAADYDLIENEPLLANPSFEGLRTQYLAVGAEFNALDFMMLRVGALKNLADGISGGAQDTTLTAGIGFWLGFNLDIAVIYADNSLGGMLQTGFRF